MAKILRSSVPDQLKVSIRRQYVFAGRLTARHRMTPGLIVVGAQRCGTTSLFRALEQHPQLIRPTFNKGINYFDLNYHRGPSWYAGHFPLAAVARRRSVPGRPGLAFEASGYYLFHPAAPARIARDLPDVKIVVMLRDPAERAYSAWKHEKARGFETEPFHEALEKEGERTASELVRMKSDPTYESFAYRHHAYSARSDYVPQLREFYDRLSGAQVHVIYAESFFASPEREFKMLTDFLGVDHVRGIAFDQHNARTSGPMPERARILLSRRFRDQADELEELVGRRPPWATGPAPHA